MRKLRLETRRPDTGTEILSRMRRRSCPRFFPALQPLDIVMGVVCLALAVYAVVVQRALAKFRAKGPMMYYLMYIVNTAVTVLYLLIGSIIIGQSAFTAEVAGSIIGSLVMLFVNIRISTTANTFL